MLFMLDELHRTCFLDSWIGIVIPICFGCLPHRKGVSFARKVLSAQPGTAYHLIDRQACSPRHIIALAIYTSCYSLSTVNSSID